MVVREIGEEDISIEEQHTARRPRLPCDGVEVCQKAIRIKPKESSFRKDTRELPLHDIEAVDA
ncbi:MAG: hypothetical protein QJR03_10310 [Sphaerobacter sp.]|nr:hypothetical protein [Sphaerobacter sp.]